MIEVYHFSELEILAFLLVFARVSAFFATWPVLSLTNVPVYVKVLFSLAVAMVLFPGVGWKSLDAKSVQELYIFLLIKEVFIGILMGFVAKTFFAAIESCGNLVSDAMGLGSAQVLNPTSGERSSILEQYYLILVTMFYLLINGHHFFITGLFKSFEIVPVSTIGISLLGFGNVGAIAQAIVIMGIKLAAPVVVSLFAMNIALGVIGRAVPQMNVLITSLSVNILLGIFVMLISLPMVVDALPGLLNETLARLFETLKTL